MYRKTHTPFQIFLRWRTRDSYCREPKAWNTHPCIRDLQWQFQTEWRVAHDDNVEQCGGLVCLQLISHRFELLSHTLLQAHIHYSPRLDTMGSSFHHVTQCLTLFSKTLDGTDINVSLTASRSLKPVVTLLSRNRFLTQPNICSIGL